jgi:hypothetical protein
MEINTQILLVLWLYPVTFCFGLAPIVIGGLKIIQKRHSVSPTDTKEYFQRIPLAIRAILLVFSISPLDENFSRFYGIYVFIYPINITIGMLSSGLMIEEFYNRYLQENNMFYLLVLFFYLPITGISFAQAMRFIYLFYSNVKNRNKMS